MENRAFCVYGGKTEMRGIGTKIKQDTVLQEEFCGAEISNQEA